MARAKAHERRMATGARSREREARRNVLWRLGLDPNTASTQMSKDDEVEGEDDREEVDNEASYDAFFAAIYAERVVILDVGEGSSSSAVGGSGACFLSPPPPGPPLPSVTRVEASPEMESGRRRCCARSSSVAVASSVLSNAKFAPPCPDEHVDAAALTATASAASRGGRGVAVRDHRPWCGPRGGNNSAPAGERGGAAASGRRVFIDSTHCGGTVNPAFPSFGATAGIS